MLYIIDIDRVVPLKKVTYYGSVVAEAGTFLIKMDYDNTLDYGIDVEYRLPAPYCSGIIEFTAETAAGRVHSTILELDEAHRLAEDQDNQGFATGLLTMDKRGGMTVNLGRFNPGEKISIEIKYICPVSSLKGKTRIIIPTLLAPLYDGYVGTEDQSHLVELDVSYTGSGHIISVDSPSHSIQHSVDNNRVNITLAESATPNSDIVIDINEEQPDIPIVYYYKDYCRYVFSPDIPGAQRPVGCEYIFMLDISQSMAGGKFEQARKALLICLRALRLGDNFNIIAFECRNHYFSINSIPFNQATLESAQRWLERLQPMGDTNMFEALRHACEGQAKNKIILLITDGQISDSHRVINFISKNPNVELHTLGIDSTANTGVINDIARAGGGGAEVLHLGEDIGNAISSMFNQILTLGLKNAKITLLNAAISDLTPRSFDTLTGGCVVKSGAKFFGSLPTTLRLSGVIDGKEFSQQVECTAIEADDTLRYSYLLSRIDALKAEIGYMETPRDKLVRREIINISLSSGILTPYTAFALILQSAQAADKKITIPALPPKGWKADSISLSDNDDSLSSLMLTQQADGAFNDGSIQQMGIILHKILTWEANVHQYRWQIKKAVIYVLEMIERGQYETMSKELIIALDIWCKTLAEQDTYHKNAEAIVYMNRVLLI